jgi:hypothetical protein
MFVMCLTYSLLVLGPWALVGNIVILLFYPIMVSIAVQFTNKPLLFRIAWYSEHHGTSDTGGSTKIK